LKRAYFNKRSESRILSLFLLKLVLSIKLVRAIGNKWSKIGHMLQKYITNPINDGVRRLSFNESVTKACVDCQNISDIPEDLLDEVLSALGWDYFGFLNACNPCLGKMKMRYLLE
jgi:hypothetical protein